MTAASQFIRPMGISGGSLALPGATTPFFAAGSGSQAIYVAHKLDLVVAIAAAKLPEGSRGLIDDWIIPAFTRLALAPATPCLTHLESGSSR